MFRKYVFIIIAVLVTGFVFSGCVSGKTAGDTAESSVPSPLTEPQKPNSDPGNIILGGYSRANTDSEITVNSFAFLEKQLLVNYPDIQNSVIIKSEIQVVAGYKVRLSCRYYSPQDDEEKYLKAVILIDPDNNYSLLKLITDLQKE